MNASQMRPLHGSPGDGPAVLITRRQAVCKRLLPGAGTPGVAHLGGDSTGAEASAVSLIHNGHGDAGAQLRREPSTLPSEAYKKRAASRTVARLMRTAEPASCASQALAWSLASSNSSDSPRDLYCCFPARPRSRATHVSGPRRKPNAPPLERRCLRVSPNGHPIAFSIQLRLKQPKRNATPRAVYVSPTVACGAPDILAHSRAPEVQCTLRPPALTHDARARCDNCRSLRIRHRSALINWT